MKQMKQPALLFTHKPFCVFKRVKLPTARYSWRVPAVYIDHMKG
jgi:hypothetical protein